MIVNGDEFNLRGGKYIYCSRADNPDVYFFGLRNQIVTFKGTDYKVLSTERADYKLLHDESDDGIAFALKVQKVESLKMKNLRVAFDIGGVISKYPDQFRQLITALVDGGGDLFVITDMHKKDEVMKQLVENGFCMISEQNVHCADYDTHGEFCKAVLLRDLKIDIFFDDFLGYVNWDSEFGEAPIRCLLAPNGYKPYWHETWKCEGGEFGRRKFSSPKKKG